MRTETIEITINPEWDNTRIRFAEHLVDHLQDILNDDTIMFVSASMDEAGRGLLLTCAIMGSFDNCHEMLLAAIQNDKNVEQLIMEVGGTHIKTAIDKVSNGFLAALGTDKIKALVGEEAFDQIFPNAEKDEKAAAAQRNTESNPFSPN